MPSTSAIYTGKNCRRGHQNSGLATSFGQGLSAIASVAVRGCRNSGRLFSPLLDTADFRNGVLQVRYYCRIAFAQPGCDLVACRKSMRDFVFEIGIRSFSLDIGCGGVETVEVIGSDAVVLQQRFVIRYLDVAA